jgi:hypothetical protein
MTFSYEQGGFSGTPAKPGKTAAEVLQALGSNARLGLAEVEARARLARDGANEVPEERPHPFLTFARKFWGVSAWMIELIALLSFILHKHADLAVALALLVVNAILSFLQEQRASGAVSALRRRLQVTGRVVRDGAWCALPARELVPGDVVRVRTGDFVPADVQVLDGELLALFSIVSIRERRAFWSSRPSGILLAALTADGCVGALIGIYGLAELQPLPLGQIGLIIAYALICSMIANDFIKSALMAHCWKTPRAGVRVHPTERTSSKG